MQVSEHDIVGEVGPEKLDAGEVVLRREFPAEVSASGDGRTLEVRVVPYNEVATVADPPHYTPYQEMWVPGAFERQLSAPNRVSVFVNVEHEQGIKGVVGRGTSLRETPDGLHGTFRMLQHPDADKALELVNEGDLTGVSLEFTAGQSVREGGIVKRLKARLVNIALVRPSGSAGGIQAYKGAGVLAVRETPPAPEPDEPAPEPEPDSPSEAELALQRIGFEPLVVRAVIRKPWVGSAARFADDEYARSCLIDRGGDALVKERCSLPVLEPNGDVNANALKPAADVLSGARAGLRGVSPADKAKAARKLMRYYAQADMDPPTSLRRVAAS